MGIPKLYQTYSPIIGVSETLKSKQFLLADSSNKIDRILIFGRPRGLKIIKNSKIWYYDVTFRVATLLFAQIYVILVEALRDLPIFDNLHIASKQGLQQI